MDRGLIRYRSDNSDLDPEDWHWQTLQPVNDRYFDLPAQDTPQYEISAEYSPSEDESNELEGAWSGRRHGNRAG